MSLDPGTDDQVVTEEARGRSERFTVAPGEEITVGRTGNPLSARPDGSHDIRAVGCVRNV
ncbi:hypothetical protein ACH4NS_33960 [Streptomyces mutabilis]|uniref:hypothetical protein n=1 Tax=Streptomyces mutabilis TaxID=67332 RepID=UPI00379D79CE